MATAGRPQLSPADGQASSQDSQALLFLQTVPWGSDPALCKPGRHFLAAPILCAKPATWVHPCGRVSVSGGSNSADQTGPLRKPETQFLTFWNLIRVSLF